MNFNKLIIARIKLLFRSVKAKRAKKKLLETFKKHPQSIRKLSAAYEKFLRAVRAEHLALVTLKAINRKYSRRPILMKIRDTGSYTVSRKAKEILSETDIVCALERHKCGDCGDISADDWKHCNACMETGYGYVYSRYKTADKRYYCVITDYPKPKTKIVTEEELLNAGGNSTGAVYEKSQSYYKGIYQSGFLPDSKYDKSRRLYTEFCRDLLRGA